jgi:hypothetical protein
VKYGSIWKVIAVMKSLTVICILKFMSTLSSKQNFYGFEKKEYLVCEALGSYSVG